MLVFTAGVGENSPEMRAAVCDGPGLSWHRAGPCRQRGHRRVERDIAAPGLGRARPGDTHRRRGADRRPNGRGGQAVGLGSRPRNVGPVQSGHLVEPFNPTSSLAREVLPDPLRGILVRTCRRGRAGAAAGQPKNDNCTGHDRQNEARRALLGRRARPIRSSHVCPSRVHKLGLMSTCRFWPAKCTAPLGSHLSWCSGLVEDGLCSARRRTPG